MMLFAFGAFAQNEISDCNDAQAIKQYLTEQGFESTPVTIVGEAENIANNQIKDFAKLVVLKNGQNVSLAELVQKDIAASTSEGFTAGAVVTKNENFCEAASKAVIYNNFDKASYQFSVDIHVWDNPNSDQDLLFKRVNPIDFSKL